VISNPKPSLLMDPVLIGPQDALPPNNMIPAWGDALAKIGPPSNGAGSGGGIGSGSGAGIGSGIGGGFGAGAGGGIGGGVYTAGGGGVSNPILVRMIEPQFSEEARKARYSGDVLLTIVVDTNGRVIDLRIAKGLGLGLDEKAIEAVKQWLFKPGYR